MSNFDNIGQLMYLPLEKIDSEGEFAESEFLIEAAVESVANANGRNWIPLIVQEVGSKYKLVSNHFIYAVMHRANLEKAWAIVIDPDPNNIKQAQILSKEITPKVNLSTASRSTIEAGLRFLSLNELKGVDVIIATNRIDGADRTTWENFTPIAKLGCGITKGKKLDSLSQVFYLEPPVKEVVPEAPPLISIKKATRDEIFERLNYLFKYKIGGFEKIDPNLTSDAIFVEQKSKWKSLNPVTKLNCGIDTAKIKTLKTLFTL